MRISILFYHPKNHLNLHDAAYVAYSVGSMLYVVPRPQTDYKLEMLPDKIRNRIIMLDKLADIVNYESDSLTIILETYGTRYLSELDLNDVDKIVLGIAAEDYGIPYKELATLHDYIVAKLPLSVEGMSYNVVSSLVMALYELKRGRDNIA